MILSPLLPLFRQTRSADTRHYERGFKQIVEVDRNVAFVDCGLFGQCLSDKSADKPLTFSYRVIEISEVLKVADRS